jgi:hypothetical protein
MLIVLQLGHLSLDDSRPTTLYLIVEKCVGLQSTSLFTKKTLRRGLHYASEILKANI